ncbi:hypothetical protein VNO77_22517 [Canavalia gladiata]|uniref:Uncharacterized protein n=1 Tax=Canavalia gladiata TaxID=3824 RepID=A0AAN9L3P7_CANGL
MDPNPPPSMTPNSTFVDLDYYMNGLMFWPKGLKTGPRYIKHPLNNIEISMQEQKCLPEEALSCSCYTTGGELHGKLILSWVVGTNEGTVINDTAIIKPIDAVHPAHLHILPWALFCFKSFRFSPCIDQERVHDRKQKLVWSF